MSKPGRRQYASVPSSFDEPSSEAPIVNPARLRRTLRRHWVLVVATPLLLAGVGYALASSQATRFEAATTLVFQPTAAQQRLDGDRSNALAERELNTQAELLNGLAFQSEVDDRFGSDVSTKARALEGTDVIELTIEAPTGEAAASTADDVALLFIERRRADVQTELNDGLTALGAVVESIERDLQAVDRRLAVLDEGTVAPTVADQLTSASPDVTELRRRQSVLAEELVVAQAAMRELETEAVLTNGDVRVGAPATTPESPVSPRPIRSASVWGMLGLLLGLGMVWVRDISDRRLRSTDDMVVASSLEFAGRVAKPAELPSAGPAVLLIEEVADRFRVLASNSLTPDGATTTIQIAGLRGGEGSTFVAANLAVTLAAGGWRTALVDADLGQGSIHQIFDVESTPGTSDVLTGDPLSTAIQTSLLVPGLGLVGRGAWDSTVTLHNTSFTKMINGLRSRFDVVIVDGPPILGAGDAAVISHHVDKTILVSEADSSTRSDLESALGIVEMSGGVVTAVVLAEKSRDIVHRNRSTASRRSNRPVHPVSAGERRTNGSTGTGRSASPSVGSAETPGLHVTRASGPTVPRLAAASMPAESGATEDTRPGESSSSG